MIALITPTGARMRQFSLCMKWMRNQTYSGDVTWIIVDDCLPRVTDVLKTEFRGWNVVKIFPANTWRAGMNTQGRNMRMALDHVKKLTNVEAVFIVEDDDYYKPVYLDEMMKRLGDNDVIGETRTIYYNVRTRRYITNANTIHASLFQTAFKPRVIDDMYNSLNDKFIDAKFWKITKGKKYLFAAGNLSVGIKGLPGRGGIGAGHGNLLNMHLDIDYKKLKELIGDDAKHYKT